MDCIAGEKNPSYLPSSLGPNEATTIVYCGLEKKQSGLGRSEGYLGKEGHSAELIQLRTLTIIIFSPLYFNVVLHCVLVVGSVCRKTSSHLAVI